MLTKIEMQYMDAVIGIHKEMRKANERGVDWEQRRYEIAKNIFCTLLGNHDVLRDAAMNHHTRLVAMSAIDFADLLIEELKKEPKK